MTWWVETAVWVSFAVNMYCTVGWVIRHRRMDRQDRARMERWLAVDREQSARWQEEWARLEAVRD